MLNLTRGAELCGRFTLQENIGSGGSAEIWRVRDAHRAEEVALKILNPQLAHSDAAWQALVREHELCEKLTHAGILEVFEPVRDAEWAVLPMTLASSDLRRLRGESYSRILPVMIEIAAALEHAHARGVVHRDLKPSNVLIDLGGHIKVADFGVAAEQHDALAGANGSPFSASPQQLQGEPPSPADDVYGLGALAYELLSGYPPFYPRLDLETIMTRPAPELLPVHPTPARVVALVMRMLAKRPQDRPQSMRAVQDELHACMQDTLDNAQIASLKASDAPRADGDAVEIVTATGGRANDTVRLAPAAAESGRRVGADMPLQRRMLPWLGGAAVAAALAAVFIWLPKLATTPQIAPPPVAPSSGNEAAAAASKFASEGASFQALLQSLDRRGAAIWGGPQFAAAKALAADAIVAADANEQRVALDRMATARRRLQRVASEAPAALAAQRARAEAALASGQVVVARQALDVAQRIDPQDAQVQAAVRRATALERALPALVAADNALIARNFGAAIVAYEIVLRADPRFAPALDGLARARAAAGQDAYAKALGEAYDARRAGRVAEARAGFERARRLRPDAPEVTAGLVELAVIGGAQDLAAVRGRILALEEQERWREALAAYDALLLQDASIEFARSGKARVGPRAELAGRLQGLIESPERLAAPEVRAEAQRLLARARRIGGAAPVLRAQVARLEVLLPGFEQPIRITIESDNMTQITVQRVVELGAFERREITLRPGRYTLIGTRPGYRDVRREVTVMPGSTAQIVQVRCVESI